MTAAPLSEVLEPKLRPATTSDIPTITEIYRRHVLNGLASFEEEPPAVTEMRQRYREVTRRGLPYLVATSGGTILGYAYAGPYRTRSAYRFSLEDSVYIAPERIGHGIGRTHEPGRK
jgi:phosphinothricin acetyltransferase